MIQFIAGFICGGASAIFCLALAQASKKRDSFNNTEEGNND